MRGTVTRGDRERRHQGRSRPIGAGSAVGAIIGGIIGGVKGALIGVLIGGGGTMVATEGKDVTLPAGTILRVELMDTPPRTGDLELDERTRHESWLADQTALRHRFLRRAPP